MVSEEVKSNMANNCEATKYFGDVLQDKVKVKRKCNKSDAKAELRNGQ